MANIGRVEWFLLLRPRNIASLPLAYTFYSELVMMEMTTDDHSLQHTTDIGHQGNSSKRPATAVAAMEDEERSARTWNGRTNWYIC